MKNGEDRGYGDLYAPMVVDKMRMLGVQASEDGNTGGEGCGGRRGKTP